MTYSYKYWIDALMGLNPQASVDDPQPGFYRRKIKGGGFEPVAIYLDMIDSQCLLCRIGNRSVPPEIIGEIWSFCCQHPITEETYRAVAERGEPWPDMDATVHDQIARIGHNRPPENEIDILREQIESAVKGLDDYKSITDDEHAQRAQSLRSRLLELARSADNGRERLVRPHLDAQREINAKWKPVVELAEDAAKKIKFVIDAFLTRKIHQAKKDGQLSEASPAPLKGAYGRAASIQIKSVIKRVLDYDALYQQFKDRAEVKDLLKKLASRAVADGHILQGVETEERAVSK